MEQVAQIPSSFEIIEMDVNEIQRPKKNPNKMTEFMFRSLIEGIKKDGFIYPVVIRKEDKRIIDGDHRYLAALEVGLTKVKAIVLDVSEKDAIKIGIGLNQKKGYFDYMELRDVLTEVVTGEDVLTLSLDIGFTDIELSRLLADSTFDSDKAIKQRLLDAGVPTEKVDAMAEVYKTGGFQDLPDLGIKGKQEKIRFPIVFFCETEDDLNLLDTFFKTEGIREPDTAKLLVMVREKMEGNA